MTDIGPRGWRRHPRILGLGGVALAGAVAAVTVWATGAGGSDSYRTAIAEPATVRQTLGVTGTVDPVHQATLAFQVSGTVATVSVAVGQHVTAGQTLASLDSTVLDQSVTSAQASLTSAQAKLSEDEAGQSTSATSATDSAATRGSSGAWLVSATTPNPSSGAATLSQAQQAVVSAQQTLDADSQKASAAFAQAQAVCASTGGSSGSSTTPSTTPTTAPSTPTTTTPTTDTTACTDALNASLSAQQQVATDEQALSGAENTLAQLLSQQQSGSGSSGGQQGTSAPTGISAPTGTSGETGRGGSTGSNGSNGSSGSNGSGSSLTFGGSGGAGGTGGSGAATSSAEQVALDQAAIDTATANLIDAQQAQAEAQLVSPITGAVAAVTLSAGQSVSSGSTADAITVINSGSYQVVSSVTGAQSREVNEGDRALVTVNGTTTTLRGTVARVGPAGTTGSEYTYPVIVALPAGSHGIAAGSSAVVQVVLHDVPHTLAVPSSAVNKMAAGVSYVVVLQSGHETRTRVKVGIVGSQYTQITSGLQRGTTVVLADLGAAVPSSNTSSSFRGFGGAGPGGAGFGGAGFGGAGFGGAGFGGAGFGGAGFGGKSAA